MNAAHGDLLAGVPTLATRYRIILTEPEQSDTADAMKASGGDTAAFERLYRRHRDRIYRLARRMIGDEEVDDAAQDIFFRAWSNLGSYRADAAFSTWLHRLALNVLIRRAEQSRLMSKRLTGDVGDAILTPSATADTQIDLDRLLATLPPELRATVVLHDIEGFSHHEVADMLSISLPAARMRLHRARLALRAFVEGR